MKGLRLTMVFAVLVVASLAAHASAWAQDGDEWAYVITSQVWASHIAKNGLVTSSSLAGFEPQFDQSGNVLRNPFQGRNAKPVDDIDPQWGLQLAAQKGRWTLAGSFQYVNFETRSDLFYTPSDGVTRCVSVQLPPFNNPFLFRPCLNPGDRVAQEFVNTTRVDVDFTASYLFPDVVRDRLDLSLGAGIKVIYASASRQYGNLSQTGALFGALPPAPGLYLICSRDDCSDFAFKDRVKTKSWLYGATIPMSAILHLTNDARWLLPMSITPFVGAESRDDGNVVYAFNYDRLVRGFPTVKRLDGTTFAYGVTGDATVRHIINDSLSMYAGMRVQYIEGHEKFLAYGPIVGMSIRFGGK